MLETGQPERKAKADMKSKAGADVDLDSAGRCIADNGSGPSPVDFAYLRRYTLGDASLEREVLELFCSHAPGLVSDLASASSEKAWRDAAHSLKGSALSLGIWEVAREAERAQAASAQYGEAGDIVTNLARMVDDVRSFVAALYLHA